MISLLVADWILGIARFHFPFFKYIFAAVNFPFSMIFLWLEKQNNIWWHEFFFGFAGDEIGSFVAFLLMIFF